MTSPAARLRQLADAVDRGEPVAAEVVAAAIGELRALQAETTRSALRRRRAAALVGLAEMLAPGGRVSVQADAVRRSVRLYGLKWRRVDRFLADMPISYVGKPEQHLWQAFSAGAELDSSNPLPLGKTFLRGLLTSYCTYLESQSAE